MTSHSGPPAIATSSLGMSRVADCFDRVVDRLVLLEASGKKAAAASKNGGMDEVLGTTALQMLAGGLIMTAVGTLAASGRCSSLRAGR